MKRLFRFFFPWFVVGHRNDVVKAINSLYSLLHPDNPKGYLMNTDLLATLAACGSAITALQNKAATTPSSNFATQDVVDAINANASLLGVTPVPVASAPVLPASAPAVL